MEGALFQGNINRVVEEEVLIMKRHNGRLLMVWLFGNNSNNEIMVHQWKV